MYNSNFGKEFKRMQRQAVRLALFNMVIKLAFWLGLFGGAIWILKYFKIV